MMDTLQRFIFEERFGARRAGRDFRHLATGAGAQDYPAPVRTLLGEMLAAAALLSANLKFNGMLVMQIHGDGPVRLLVVECDSELQLRATAKLAPDAVIDRTMSAAAAGQCAWPWPLCDHARSERQACRANSPIRASSRSMAIRSRW